MKKVSIIIPVYNVEPYIGPCLLSVLNQTYDNIECIVIDDRGSDNSMNEVERIISEDIKGVMVKIVRHDRNKGLSEARNTGIKEATGDYLFFLDSDDYISVTAISEMMRLVDKYNVDFVIGAIRPFGRCVNNKEYLRLHEDVVIGTPNIALRYSESKWYMMAPNKLLSRRMVIGNDLFFYPNIYHEDELWSLRLACTAKSMAICHMDTYFYRIRSASITSMVSEKHIKDLTLIVNESTHILNQNQFTCLYSPIRTLYLRIVTLLNSSSFSPEFKQSIYIQIKDFYALSLRNIFIYPFCLKNWIKYLLCLIPLPLLSVLLKYIRVWK